MAAPVAVLIHSPALTFRADASQAFDNLMFFGCYGFYGGKVKVTAGDAEVWQAALGEKSSGVRSVYWVIICPNSLEGKRGG